MKRLRDTQAKFPQQLTIEGLQAEALALYNSETIQKDKGFPNNEAKLIYCTKAIKNKYNTRQPLDKYDIVAFGVDKESNFDGNRKNSIYVLVEEEDKNKNKSMVVRHCDFAGTDCDKIKAMTFPAMYQGVELVRFQNGNFKADDRAIFKEPVDVPDILAMLREAGVKDCTIADAAKNFPADVVTPKNTFADKNDLRIVKAMVGDVGKDPKGESWGRYAINDETVDRQDLVEEIDHEKFLIKRSFSVWCHPIMAVVPKNNEAYFVGSFSAQRGSKANPKPEPFEVNMNACLVVPDRIIFGGQ